MRVIDKIMADLEEEASSKRFRANWDEAWEKCGEGEVILSTRPDMEVEYS